MKPSKGWASAMRIKKTPSVYSQKRGSSNITDFVAEKAARSYRVELRNELSGQSLKLVAPHKDVPGGEHPIDISYLLDFPHLWEPFSEAIATTSRRADAAFVTVNQKCTQINTGFISYLRIVAPGATLGHITTTLFEGYIKWLGRTENGIPKYKKKSKQLLEFPATAMLKYLQSADKWKHEVSPELTFRLNYWRGEPDDSTRVKIIPEETYSEIYVACKQEISSTMAQVRHLRSLMHARSNHPAALQNDVYPSHAYYPSGRPIKKIWQDNPYRDIGISLAALRKRTPGIILRISELDNMQDKMLLRVLEDNHIFGGIPALHPCFYPTARNLVPFVLMLAIHLDYNPDTLLKSLLSDYVVRKNEVGSLELVATPENIARGKKSKSAEVDEPDDAEVEILAEAKKGRSKYRRQHQIRPATNDPDNPASIVAFIEEWTSFIRPLAPPVARARLLLYVTENGERQISSFAGVHTPSRASSWRNGLSRFYKDHGLPHTAFNRFRTTGLDVSDALFNGDIRAKQAAGNHASADTTYRMYTTSAAQQRGDEFLGNVGQLRKRWRESKGKVDPRNRPNATDLGAATPGWSCADPFSGPYTPNKLCASYGLCPGCPHAGIALDDPYACAQAWNLLNTIDDAAAELAPEAWLKRWSPIKTKLLEVWLPRFPASIVEKAKTMTLAKLPPLE